MKAFQKLYLGSDELIKKKETVLIRIVQRNPLTPCSKSLIAQ